MFSNSKLTVIAVCVVALFSSGHAHTMPELPQRRLRGDSYGGGVTQSFNFNAAGGGGGGYGSNSAQNNNPVPLPAVPAFVPAPAMPPSGAAVYVPAPAAAPSGCAGGVGNGGMNSNCQSAPAFAPAPAPLPQVPTGATNLWCKDAAGNDIDPSNCFSGLIPVPQPALASVPTQVSAPAPAPAPLPQVPTGATNLWCKDAAGNDIDPSNCFSGPIPAPQPALASVPTQVSAPAPAPAPLPQVPTGATNLWCKDAAGNDIDPSNCFSGPIPVPRPAPTPAPVTAPASGTSGMNTPIQQ